MKFLSILFFSLFIFSCASHKKYSNKIELSFLDEYIIPLGEEFEGTSIGGLSGIDYVDDTYYL